MKKPAAVTFREDE